MVGHHCKKLQVLYFKINKPKNKTGVINDSLGQTHSHTSSEHCFLLFCFSSVDGLLYGRTDGLKTCVKTMAVTLGWPCGLSKNKYVKYNLHDI